MLCLHGEEAAELTNDKKPRKVWFCNRSDKCHFVCYDEEKELYENGIKAFLETKQPIPKCCHGEKTRRQCRMKVVKDRNKANFGRPYFECPKRTSNEEEECGYFAWGDQTILEAPLCKHGKPSRLFRVKKEGPNKDRCFFTCSEKNQAMKCKFFKWLHDPDDGDDDDDDDDKRNL